MVYPLNEYAASDPSRLMATDGQNAHTTADVNRRTNQLIHAFRSYGLDPGSRLAIVANNSSDYLCIALAAGLSGISLVPINWHLKAQEAAYLLEASGANGIVIDPDHRSLGEAAASEAGIDLCISLATLVESLAQRPDTEPQDPGPFSSVIYYTSGTTGRPKGTRLAQTPTAVPLEEAIATMRKAAGSSAQQQATVFLTPGPLYHAAPLNTSISAVLLGGTIHIMPRFDPEEMLKLIDKYKVQRTTMVPIMFNRLLNLPDQVREKYDVSSLETVTHLAAHIPVHVKHEMIKWWGPKLVDAYGSSEVGVVSLISSEEWLQRPGSVGKPIPSLSLQIIDEQDREAPIGETGMIYITSHTELDISYLDDAEKTASVHRGEKQFTLGDMGYLDEEGYLFLVDRRVDMINSAGVNVYPAEIESTVMLHPSVDDVGVFGIPNQEWGQEVKAAIKLREGFAASDGLAQEITTFLEGMLASYKVPKSIDFMEELPRYTNGKLHRRELRDPYWPQS